MEHSTFYLIFIPYYTNSGYFNKMNEKNHNAYLAALKHNIKQLVHQKNWPATLDGLAKLKQLAPLALETRGLEFGRS